MTTRKSHVRLACVGDLHYRSGSESKALSSVLDDMRSSADVALLCGDLTDRGLVAEIDVLAAEVLAKRGAKVIAVLGNHDVEAGEEAEIARRLVAAGVSVLDGDVCEIGGVGFAGTRGFCGGFGRAMLEPWGERVIKQFVSEAVRESRKLESALAKLHTDKRVALLHYAPIRTTVEGENPEIIPFLGSSRLAEPINAFGASLVVHGHAHYGKPEGRTAAGVPVFNCALPLRQRMTPEHPFLVVDL